MKILFICSQNKLRSPTAEVLFSIYKGLEVTSAGTAPGAETPVSRIWWSGRRRSS